MATACVAEETDMKIKLMSRYIGAELSGVNGEVCSPVTVTSLSITDEDRERHDESVSEDCGGALGCKVANANANTDTRIAFHRRDLTLPIIAIAAIGLFFLIRLARRVRSL